MIQLNSIAAIDALLAHVQRLMELAVLKDVHEFLHLTDRYAKLYCLKLRMMK